MREVKTYSKGAPFYNAFVGGSKAGPCDLPAGCLAANWLWRGQEEAYDARARGLIRKFLLKSVDPIESEQSGEE